MARLNDDLKRSISLRMVSEVFAECSRLYGEFPDLENKIRKLLSPQTTIEQMQVFDEAYDKYVRPYLKIVDTIPAWARVQMNGSQLVLTCNGNRMDIHRPADSLLACPGTYVKVEQADWERWRAIRATATERSWPVEYSRLCEMRNGARYYMRAALNEFSTINGLCNYFPMAKDAVYAMGYQRGHSGIMRSVDFRQNLLDAATARAADVKAAWREVREWIDAQTTPVAETDTGIAPLLARMAPPPKPAPVQQLTA